MSETYDDDFVYDGEEVQQQYEPNDQHQDEYNNNYNEEHYENNPNHEDMGQQQQQQPSSQLPQGSHPMQTGQITLTTETPFDAPPQPPFTIYLQCIPKEALVEDLISAFSQFGDVESAKFQDLPKGQDDNSSRIAHVQFKEASALLECLHHYSLSLVDKDLIPITLYGCQLTVERIRAGGEAVRENRLHIGGLPAASGPKLAAIPRILLTHLKSLWALKNNVLESEGAQIVLPFAISELIVRSRCAFLALNPPSASEEVIALLNGSSLDGQTLTCSPSVNKRPANPTIYVYGINTAATDAQITDYFSQFGHISSVSRRTIPGNDLVVNAFIRFSDVRHATAAIDAVSSLTSSDGVLMGSKISAEYAKESPRDARRDGDRRGERRDGRRDGRDTRDFHHNRDNRFPPRDDRRGGDDRRFASRGDDRYRRDGDRRDERRDGRYPPRDERRDERRHGDERRDGGRYPPRDDRPAFPHHDHHDDRRGGNNNIDERRDDREGRFNGEINDRRGAVGHDDRRPPHHGQRINDFDRQGDRGYRGVEERRGDERRDDRRGPVHSDERRGPVNTDDRRGPMNHHDERRGGDEQRRGGPVGHDERRGGPVINDEPRRGPVNTDDRRGPSPQQNTGLDERRGFDRPQHHQAPVPRGDDRRYNNNDRRDDRRDDRRGNNGDDRRDDRRAGGYRPPHDDSHREFRDKDEHYNNDRRQPPQQNQQYDRRDNSNNVGNNVPVNDNYPPQQGRRREITLPSGQSRSYSRPEGGFEGHDEQFSHSDPLARQRDRGYDRQTRSPPQQQRQQPQSNNPAYNEDQY